VPLEGTSPTTGGALDGRAYVLASTGRRLSAAGSSAYWAGRAGAFVRAQPGRALMLEGNKLLLAWNRRAIPQIEDIDSFARAAGPLGVPVAGSFALLALLGLAGAAWAWGGGVAERWLVGYVALVSLAMVPFFVTDRYRHHLVPALAVLAGLALARIARAVGERAAAAGVRTALVVGIAGAIVFAPIRTRTSRTGDWVFVVDRGIRLLEHGDYDQAVAAFAGAESTLGGAGVAGLTPGARTNLAAFYQRYGVALEALDRHAEAIERWERAVALDPNDAESLSRLSIAFAEIGRTAAAANARRRLSAVPGGRGRLLVDDGWAAAARGDLAGAERLFAAATQAAPDLSIAWEGLIRVRIQTGRFGAAAGALERARGAGLDPLPADIYASFLALRRGDPAAARRALHRIPTDAAPTDPVLARVLDDVRRELGVTAGR
jgi:tetratricopeptide (TPR) repeat protein